MTDYQSDAVKPICNRHGLLVLGWLLWGGSKKIERVNRLAVGTRKHGHCGEVYGCHGEVVISQRFNCILSTR